MNTMLYRVGISIGMILMLEACLFLCFYEYKNYKNVKVDLNIKRNFNRVCLLVSLVYLSGMIFVNLISVFDF